ncbi:HCL578Cp [Eremothecium sinecaudum]|uniref:cysteine--tRNA ligase n=1 Tax=Eremothecium sinecaudum TaxID=45286 RepID=A0A109UXX8_9SACH|nr:HCL578Cp [Eremothecium sinecaudum]AMD19573.1 HCL578Cp [Eremothecium sinecaudum]
MHLFLKRSVTRTIMSSSTSKIAQPKWIKPDAIKEQPALKLYNSLTRNKDEFVPISKSRKVTWYSCGPTVYDAAHMGHARNYVTIDINRRILEDYFGYDVDFVQNVTDIDDKIIIRARQEHLFEKYVSECSKVDDACLKKVKEAILAYISSKVDSKIETIESYNEWEKKIDLGKVKVEDPKLAMHVAAVRKAVDALNGHDQKPVREFLDAVKDVLVPVLDSEFGASITDPEVFRKLAAYWERSFNEDMRRLNVRAPTVTTRVSEYVDEIITFVKRIIDNGYAYVTDDGSVYFDTVRFDSAPNHDYAKCQPWNRGQHDLIADGEGALSSSSGKRSANDFALWKASKAGEPQWESPWGAGRPGWHIECSVMASDVLGSTIDIHSGGIDLAFPHHDNELAQSEACFENSQWVNYFLHTGHLHIEGQKMSKSLKNFITIEEALEKYSVRQMRLAFAFTQWNNQLDFKESAMAEVRAWEQSVGNYFRTVRALIHESMEKDVTTRQSAPEAQLRRELAEVVERGHVQLCDNLSVGLVLRGVADIVGKANVYIAERGKDVRIEVLSEIARYATKMISLIGIEVRSDGLGWKEAEKSTGEGFEEDVLPYVRCLSHFRDEIRQLARNNASSKEILRLADVLRDEHLVKLNVILEDRQEGPALVKFIDENERKRLVEEQAERTKREQQRKAAAEEARKRDAARREKARVPAEVMFLQSAEYSAWDENGVPVSDASGEPLSKSMKKKLLKQWQQQKKLNEEFKEEST